MTVGQLIQSSRGATSSSAYSANNGNSACAKNEAELCS